jgi:hypothetical protein
MSSSDVARCCNCAGDLPDVSKCFRRLKHPCQRPLVTLHGVVFDILVGSEKRGLPSRGSRAAARLRPCGFGFSPSSLRSSYAGHASP